MHGHCNGWLTQSYGGIRSWCHLAGEVGPVFFWLGERLGTWDSQWYYPWMLMVQKFRSQHQLACIINLVNYEQLYEINDQTTTNTCKISEPATVVWMIPQSEPMNQPTRLKEKWGTPKWRFGRWFSFSNRWFSGSIFIFRGVPLITKRDTPRTTPSCPCRPILYLSHLRMMALATMLGCKMGIKIAVSWLIPTYLEEEGGPRKLFVDMARVWLKYSGFLAKNVRSWKKEFWSTCM